SDADGEEPAGSDSEADGDEDDDLAKIDGGTTDGVVVTDDANGMVYRAAYDNGGNCLCSSNLSGSFVDEDKSLLLNTRVAAPPEDVESVTVQIPHFGTFDDVPLSRSQDTPPSACSSPPVSSPGSPLAFPLTQTLMRKRCGSCRPRVRLRTSRPFRDSPRRCIRLLPRPGASSSARRTCAGRPAARPPRRPNASPSRGTCSSISTRLRSRRRRRTNSARSPRSCARWRSRRSTWAGILTR